MSLTRRGFQAVTTWVVVVAWVLFYVVALASADPLPPVETAVVQLVVPPLLWEVAVRFVLRYSWSAAGSRMSAMDPPGRLLAAVVAALPERRGEWGRAMTAELAEVEGRSARWRFVLSCARAALWLRPAGGWPVLALVAGVVVASVAAAGPVSAGRCLGSGCSRRPSPGSSVRWWCWPSPARAGRGCRCRLRPCS
jgi:hypothetical protein